MSIKWTSLLKSIKWTTSSQNEILVHKMDELNIIVHKVDEFIKIYKMDDFIPKG